MLKRYKKEYIRVGNKRKTRDECPLRSIVMAWRKSLKFTIFKGFLQGDVREWQDTDMLFRKTFNWQQGWIMDGRKPDYGFNGSRILEKKKNPEERIP